MAKGLAVSGSSDLGRIGGGSNAGLIPCNEKKNDIKNGVNPKENS